MYLKKYIIIIVIAIISLFNIIILDIIEVKMCKSFSVYRLFTMNSTVCTNISKAVGVLEKMLTTVVIALCSTVFQTSIGYYTRTVVSYSTQHDKIKTIDLK